MLLNAPAYSWSCCSCYMTIWLSYFLNALRNTQFGLLNIEKVSSILWPLVWLSPNSVNIANTSKQGRTIVILQEEWHKTPGQPSRLFLCAKAHTSALISTGSRAGSLSPPLCAMLFVLIFVSYLKNVMGRLFFCSTHGKQIVPYSKHVVFIYSSSVPINPWLKLNS